MVFLDDMFVSDTKEDIGILLLQKLIYEYKLGFPAFYPTWKYLKKE